MQGFLKEYNHITTTRQIIKFMFVALDCTAKIVFSFPVKTAL